MNRKNMILALTAIATTCLAFFFIYSWGHAGPPEYMPSGKRIISPTLLISGAAFLFALLSLFSQIRGKK
jgi:hypothetical protein